MAALVDLVRAHPHPGVITTSDVAERAGLPIGSLYVYFEDLGSIVDATVVAMLERHDVMLARALEAPVTSVEQLVDRLFDTYVELYRDEPGFVSLRGTSLFEPRHMEWLRTRVLNLVGLTAESLAGAGIAPAGADIAARIDLAFVLGDTILLHAYRSDPSGDQAILDQGREILHFALRRITAPQSGE